MKQNQINKKNENQNYDFGLPACCAGRPHGSTTTD